MHHIYADDTLLFIPLKCNSGGKSWPNVRESDSYSKGCEFESRAGRNCRWGSECTALSPPSIP